MQPDSVKDFTLRLKSEIWAYAIVLIQKGMAFDKAFELSVYKSAGSGLMHEWKGGRKK